MIRSSSRRLVARRFSAWTAGAPSLRCYPLPGAAAAEREGPSPLRHVSGRSVALPRSRGATMTHLRARSHSAPYPLAAFGTSSGQKDDDDEVNAGAPTPSRSDAWVPPGRPLSGDAGQSHVYASESRRRRREERDRAAVAEEEEEEASPGSDDDDGDDEITEDDLPEGLREILDSAADGAVIDLEKLNINFSDLGEGWEKVAAEEGVEPTEWVEAQEDEDGSLSREDIEAIQRQFGDEVENKVVSVDDFDAGDDGAKGDDFDDDDDDDEDEGTLEEQQEALDRYEEEIIREEEEEAIRKRQEREEEEKTLALLGQEFEDGDASLNMDDFLARQAKIASEDNSDNDTDGDGDWVPPSLDASGAKQRRNAATGPDWLATRRAKLGSDADGSIGAAATTTTTTTRVRAIDMLTPEDGAAARDLDSEIPAVIHTLLSSSEIVRCVSVLGGRDARVVRPTPLPDGTSPYGSTQEGIVIVTGESASHVRVIAEGVVRNLKRRKLGEVGVVGGALGAEGGEDAAVSKLRRRKRGLRGSRKIDDGWMAVDCKNWVVHVQDDETRTAVDLEGLWAGEEGRKLRSLDASDEDAVDEYVAANPVPDAYARSVMFDTNVGVLGGGGVGVSLGRNLGSWGAPSPAAGPPKKRGKRKGKRRR